MMRHPANYPEDWGNRAEDWGNRLARGRCAVEVPILAPAPLSVAPRVSRAPSRARVTAPVGTGATQRSQGRGRGRSKSRPRSPLAAPAPALDIIGCGVPPMPPLAAVGHAPAAIGYGGPRPCRHWLAHGRVSRARPGAMAAERGLELVRELHRAAGGHLPPFRVSSGNSGMGSAARPLPLTVRAVADGRDAAGAGGDAGAVRAEPGGRVSWAPAEHGRCCPAPALLLRFYLLPLIP